MGGCHAGIGRVDPAGHTLSPEANLDVKRAAGAGGVSRGNMQTPQKSLSQPEYSNEEFLHCSVTTLTTVMLLSHNPVSCSHNTVHVVAELDISDSSNITALTLQM